MAKVFIRGVAFIGEESDGPVDRLYLRAVEIEVDVPESGDLEADVVSVTMTTRAQLRKMPDELHDAAGELLKRLYD